MRFQRHLLEQVIGIAGAVGYSFLAEVEFVEQIQMQVRQRSRLVMIDVPPALYLARGAAGELTITALTALRIQPARSDGPL